MSKKILYLLRADLEGLPPSMSQILTLCRLGCTVQVVTMQASDYIRDFYKDSPVAFLTLAPGNTGKGNPLKKVQGLLGYRSLVKKALAGSYDSLWVGSADTARYCKDILKDRAVDVLNVYELYDTHMEVIRAITPIAQKAKCVVAPEYNRAHILKVWMGLKKTPLVIPNRPCFPETQIQPETQKIVDELKAMNKKFVLYQGWIGKDRDVSQIARAMATMPDKDAYTLLLLGTVTSPDTIPALQAIFPATVHVPFLQPPQHLFITELAHMGIATYDDSCLNNIFCAPNKIHEYAEKKVPILARDIPGLYSTVGVYKAGVCVDMSDIDAIAGAIHEISANHEAYQQALEHFLEVHRADILIEKVLRICEEN